MFINIRKQKQNSVLKDGDTDVVSSVAERQKGSLLIHRLQLQPKITPSASTVTNGTNTVSQQEYYEYDSVGNITGIYRIEDNEKVYYNKYYYDEANQLVREDNRTGDFTGTLPFIGF